MARKYIDVPFEKEDVQENGIFKGYGSTFGGKPDSYGDIIAPGAFSETLLKNGRGGMGVSMLWQHKSDEPIGVWTALSEDRRGLKLEGKLEIDSEFGKRIHGLMKMGALKGLSIGFDMPRDKNGKVDPSTYEIDSKKNTRLLKRINLWEVSPVTFPANTRARITGVKSIEEAKTEREMERILRDSGLSKSDAVYLASLCKSGLRDSGAGNGISELLNVVQKTSQELKNDIALINLRNSLNDVNNMLK